MPHRLFRLLAVIWAGSQWTIGYLVAPLLFATVDRVTADVRRAVLSGALPPGQTFSIYSLAALLPLLPAKQRALHPNDWMNTDAEVACPDPNCTTRFRITRGKLRRFNRADVTATPAQGSNG